MKQKIRLDFNDNRINIISFIQSITILYLFDPLRNNGVRSWDRTFCEALLYGISTDARVTRLIIQIILFIVAIIFFDVINTLVLGDQTDKKLQLVFKRYLLVAVPVSILFILRYRVEISSYIKYCLLVVVVILQVFFLLFSGEKQHVFDKETIINSFKNNAKNAFLSFYCCFVLLYFVCPVSLPETYEGQFKEHVLRNYVKICILQNAGLLIAIGLTGLAFLLFWYVTYRLIKKYIDDKSMLYNFAFDMSLLSLIPIVVSFIYKFFCSKTAGLGIYIKYDNSVDRLSSLGVLLVAFMVIIGVECFLKNEKLLMKKKPYKWIFAFAINSVSISFFSKNFVTGIIICSVLFLIYDLVMKDETKKEQFLLGTLFLPGILVLVVDVLFSINEKGIFIKNYYMIIIPVLIILAIINLIIVLFVKKKIGDRVYYIAGIVSLCMYRGFSFVYQKVFEVGDYANVFELGNNSVVEDTFLYGKLPIIDYFPAHALLDVFNNLVTHLIHNDYRYFFESPHAWYLAWIAPVLLFVILALVIPDSYAALIILFFPVSIQGIRFMDLCLLGIVAAIYLIKKNSTFSMILFWVCTLFVAFYLYDEGIGLGIACIFTLCVIYISRAEYKSLFRFILTGALIGLCAGSFYLVYCFSTGLNPINRALEWASIGFAYNETWGTKEFGNIRSVRVLVAYYIAPMSAAYVFVVSGYRIIKKDLRITRVLSFILAIEQLMFVSRGVTFHNLTICKGITGVLMNVWPFTMAFFCVAERYEGEHRNKETAQLLIVVLCTVILIENALVIWSVPSNNLSMYESATISSIKQGISTDMSKIKDEDRTIIGAESEEFINGFKSVFDELLKDDETFFDFSNITSLYALTGRKRPFYISQSPSILTNTDSQKYYLDEIKESKIPLAILGSTDESYTQQMMGIHHNIRYYLIAEYVFERYRPLVEVGDFAIWCEKERYDEFKDKLTLSRNIGDKLIDYGYDKVDLGEESCVKADENRTHSYFIGELAYIWANLDVRRSSDNKLISRLKTNEKNVFDFAGSDTVRSKNGNYIEFECDNPGILSEMVIELTDSNNNEIGYQYRVFLRNGNNRYMIRVSQDYFWYDYNIDTVRFYAKDGMKIDNVACLEGD